MTDNTSLSKTTEKDLLVHDGEHIISQINDCIHDVELDEEYPPLFVSLIDTTPTLTDLDKQYDLQKFLESLEHEDMNWKTEKVASGVMEFEFWDVSVPQEYWDDPKRFAESIYPDDVELGCAYTTIDSVSTECTGTICIGPAVLKKLQNSRREVVL